MPMDKNKLETILADPEFMSLPENEQESFLDEMSNSVLDTRNPLQKGLSNAGDILSGGFKRQMAAGPASFNTLTGGPATEFAHGVKSEAMHKAGVPDWIGEGISTATDPQSLLSGALTRLGESAIFNPGAMQRLKAMKIAAKGRATVSRLLPAANIAEDVKANRPSGVQVEGFNLIKKNKNPKNIVDSFRNEKNKVISNVDQLVEQNNKPINPGAIRERVNQILDKQLSNSNPDEVASINQAIDQEFSQLPLDTKSANARKRFLYEKTQNLQKAQRKGQSIVNKPEQGLVDDAFSQAYKEFIEESHPDIKVNNQRFPGLDQGETAASKLVEGEVEQTPMGERVASQTIGRPSVQSGFAALVRELPFIGSSPRRLTGIIEKLRGQYGEALSSSRESQANRLIGKEFFNPTEVPVENKPYVPFGLGASGSAKGSFPEFTPEEPPMNPIQYKGGAGKSSFPEIQPTPEIIHFGMKYNPVESGVSHTYEPSPLGDMPEVPYKGNKRIDTFKKLKGKK